MLSAARVVVGAVLLAAPGIAGGAWIGDPARDRRTKMIIRGFGARDLALGLGTLRALDRGEPVETWARMSAFGDIGDAGAALLGGRGLGFARTCMTVISAGTAAALGTAAANNLD
ncbi:unannotated protein [freshwater metagenome]|uniref:Unannotated protein n=1 Tax=freshwater metagenome TaxID=449393 RepID=A0A6J6HZY2_9ZZZZ|nr:hypothetical protein [Actinomycetota bacterium]